MGKSTRFRNAPFNTIAITPIGANKTLVVTKLNGKILEKSRAVFQGGTITETSESTDSARKTFRNVEVFGKP
jgi:hypothetical protein